MRPPTKSPGVMESKALRSAGTLAPLPLAVTRNGRLRMLPRMRLALASV